VLLVQGAAQLLFKQTRLAQLLSCVHTAPLGEPVVGMHTDSSAVPPMFGTIAQVVPAVQSLREVQGVAGLVTQIDLLTEVPSVACSVTLAQTVPVAQSVLFKQPIVHMSLKRSE